MRIRTPHGHFTKIADPVLTGAAEKTSRWI